MEELQREPDIRIRSEWVPKPKAKIRKKNTHLKPKKKKRK